MTDSLKAHHFSQILLEAKKKRQSPTTQGAATALLYEVIAPRRYPL